MECCLRQPIRRRRPYAPSLSRTWRRFGLRTEQNTGTVTCAQASGPQKQEFSKGERSKSSQDVHRRH